MFYTPFVFFGYEISLSPEDRSETIAMMYDLNGMIRSPFEIRCILPTFYPLMNEEEYARLVIGFIPESIDTIFDQSNELRSFLEDTPLFDECELSCDPAFHCGIEWIPEVDSDSSDSSDSSDEEA